MLPSTGRGLLGCIRMLIYKPHEESRRGRISTVLLLLIVLLGSGTYTAYYLKRIYHEKDLEIQELKIVVDRLEAETRVAEILVTEQGRNAETGRLETTIKFLELDRNGEPLSPRHFTVEGDIIYFDSLVIKFDHNYVERGEALRGKSISLFRRIFGEHQKPNEGFPIDEGSDRGSVPDIFRVNSQPTAFEVELWKEFWRYAVDPKEAKRKGVRIIQGEAVYTRFIPNNIYIITLDHAGGINIKVEPVRQILRDEMKTYN